MILRAGCWLFVGASFTVLLLAVVLEQRPGWPVNDVTEHVHQDEDVTSLLQSFQQLQERGARKQLKQEDARKHQPIAAKEAEPRPGCKRSFASLDFLVLGDTLRLLGYLPALPSDCRSQATLPPSSSIPAYGKLGLMLRQMTSIVHKDVGKHRKAAHDISQPDEMEILFGAPRMHGDEQEDDYDVAILVPVAYCALCIMVLARMLLGFTIQRPPDNSRHRPGFLRRPEAEAWQRGISSWLAVDWVNEWVARWGNPADGGCRKISANDLGGLGDPEDECTESYSRFSMLWEQEVERAGLPKASLVLVLARFVGCRRFLTVVLWSAIHEAAMYLGPPLAMAWAIEYIEKLYMIHMQKVELKPSDHVPGTAIAICLFTGLPILMGLSNTVSSVMSGRIGVRVCGALSALVFKKAQRLPLSGADPEYCSQDRWMQDLQQQKPKKDDQDAVQHNDDVLPEAGSERKKSTNFNLVQLVANDINTNVVQIPLMFARVVIMIPIVAVLFVMLFFRVSNTIWLCVVACLAITGIIMCYAGAQLGYMMAFYLHAGKRLQFLEDVLFNIRMLKACGWEAVAERRIAKFRTSELGALEGFYWKLGWMYCWFYQFPRAMIFISLWGYIWLFGRALPSDIFATLPLLLTFQSAVMSLMYTLPLLIAGRPSLQRIEQFLKQPESPNGWPRAVQTPKWHSVWPRILGTTNFPTPHLCVQGSFSWSPSERPVLQNVDISFPKGSSIGILGAVGSGKTSLLHAILGELHPAGDSRVSTPMRIAYAAQVPFICEASLKDNVLFGEAFHEDRYKTCIVSSGLLHDLEALPGGEEAPVGARGIALSDSQRARVSLARAAYCADADLVLLDDPYGRQDLRTTHHLLENYVHGPCLKGRTKVVVCQPEEELIRRFDVIIIMAQGRIAVQGTPTEVMQSDEFQMLLNSTQIVKPSVNSSRDGAQPVHRQNHSVLEVRNQAIPDWDVHAAEVQAVRGFQLREDECQGQASWETVRYFCGMGGWLNISVNCLGFFALSLCNLLGGIVLQHWSSQILESKAHLGAAVPEASTFLHPYLVWWVLSIFCWWGCWFFGICFTLRLSRAGNHEIVKRLLYAPVDRFFDKTPVGRIMNRMSTDMMNIDVYTYNQVTMLIGHFWTNIVPLIYLHLLMPCCFTVATAPFYVFLCVMLRRFWNTLIPMRYLTHISKSDTDMTLTEVDMSNSYVRASQTSNHRFQQFQAFMSTQMTADLTTTTFMKRWLINRLFLMFGFFVTIVMMVCIWVPGGTMSVGAIGLCLTNLLQILVDIEGFIDAGMQAQFQIISLNRLHDYTKLPQEKPAELPTDSDFQNHIIVMHRRDLGKLHSRQTANGAVIIRQNANVNGDTAWEQAEAVVLHQRTGGTHALVAAGEGGLQKLDPENEELAKLSSRHCIIGVNGAHRNADKMARELAMGTSDSVRLHVQSGWLADGARVCIEDLHAGYGDLPSSALFDVSLIVEPRSKVAIVGSTGSGKSTLLLCLLRLLEPRSGRVLINDVDTQRLGLRTLRTAAGFVPQDPVLMQASIRENMDPLGYFDDHLIWEGLRMMQLERVVKDLPGGLDFHLQGESSRLSFGQRQLLCLARAVIRQPALLLLDDATSGLDPKAQELIQCTLEVSFPDSTILMSASRADTIVDFDMAVVLDSGRVAEKGPIKELINVKESLFSTMLASSHQ